MNDRKVNLEVFRTVEYFQQNNGVSFDDYERYRRFLTRKLQRVRKNKQIKFTTKMGGKNKVTKLRDVLEETRKDEKLKITPLHLHLYLLQSERAWSFAMQLKQDIQNDGVSNGVRRRHLVSRLKKSSFWAKKLVEVCKLVGNENSIKESEAYEAVMTGTYLVETADLVQAFEYFSRATKLFVDLIAAKPKQAELLNRRKLNAEFLLLYTKRYVETEPSVAAVGVAEIGLKLNFLDLDSNREEEEEGPVQQQQQQQQQESPLPSTKAREKGWFSSWFQQQQQH